MVRKKLKYYQSRVIAGKYKGKKVYIPATSTTRSSKAILRESLFNTINFEIIDKNFVEVFAGSGLVAIEAVSRGAKKAWCIEKDRDTYEVLELNIKNVTNGEVIALWGDSFKLIYNILKELKSKDEKAFFYFDPPFSIRDGMENIYKDVFKLIENINKNFAFMIIIEHMSSLKLPNNIGEFELRKSRKFGKSSLSYFSPKEAG